MNEEQLRLFLAQAMRAQRLGTQISKSLEPALQNFLLQVLGIVEQLPDGSLTRELTWRRLQTRVLELAGPYNDAVLDSMVQQLVATTDEAIDEATKLLAAAPDPRAAAALTPARLTMSVPDSIQQALAVPIPKVSAHLSDLFIRERGVSPFMGGTGRVIDRVVRRGMLEGLTTKEIGRQIFEQTRTGRVRSEVRHILANQSESIARTAIQQYNHAINDEVYKANEDLLEGLSWEWVALLDSRTCVICAPLDGEVRPNKDNFTVQPEVHIGCRCAIVPVDPSAEASVRGAQVIRKEDPYKGDRAYKTQVKVKGEKFYRKGVDVQPIDGKRATYADYIAHTANNEGRVAFFGSRARAAKFMQYVDQGKDPQEALKRVILRPGQASAKFKSIKQL